MIPKINGSGDDGGASNDGDSSGQKANDKSKNGSLFALTSPQGLAPQFALQ
jgi:hypothetical protein